MKKTLIILCLTFYSIIGFSQHEGITRYFKSYKINLTEYSDHTYIADTLTDEFHNFYTQQKLSYNNLGWMNPGQPYMPAVFSQRAKANPFWFFDNYAKFITTHDDIIYFDTQKPFTLFNFTGGGKELELVKFLHTQNITPSLSFAFDYNITNSMGHYQSNKTKVNALSFNTSYTKHRYQSHFNFIMNKINHTENGGLADMAIFDTTSYPSNAYAANLDNAYNTISQIGVQYNHEYRFGTYNIDTIIIKSDTAINKNFETNFSLIHDVKIDRFYRIYEDVPSNFYDNIYKSNTLTFDSIAYKTIDNKLLLNFNLDEKGQIQKFQVLAGISSYLYNYHFPDTIKAKTYFSNYVTGMTKLNTKVSSLSGELNYCFIGANAFDMNIFIRYKQRLSKKMGFDAYFDYSLENPSRFLFNYNSNHFKWDINPTKVYKNAAGIDFGFDSIYLNLGVNINLLKNYFVYNQFAIPEQIAKANLIADAFVSKQFNFGSFHWLLKFTYQYMTDKENIPLPEFVGYTNFYFKKWVFQNALLLQIGADLKYHSGFYGYAYMPAIGAFYLQNTKKTGNYPNAAVYAAIKVKRLRGFVKAGNLNSMFMNQQNYLLYAIPDNPFSVNFGVSWEFYD